MEQKLDNMEHTLTAVPILRLVQTLMGQSVIVGPVMEVEMVATVVAMLNQQTVEPGVCRVVEQEVVGMLLAVVVQQVN